MSNAYAFALDSLFLMEHHTIIMLCSAAFYVKSAKFGLPAPGSNFHILYKYRRRIRFPDSIFADICYMEVA